MAWIFGFHELYEIYEHNMKSIANNYNEYNIYLEPLVAKSSAFLKVALISATGRSRTPQVGQGRHIPGNMKLFLTHWLSKRDGKRRHFPAPGRHFPALGRHRQNGPKALKPLRLKQIVMACEQIGIIASPWKSIFNDAANATAGARMPQAGKNATGRKKLPFTIRGFYFCH